MPLPDPVALVEHGRVAVAAEIAANGAASEVFRPTSLGGRADVTLTDGLAVYAGGQRLDARGEGTSRERGWRGVVGVHGAGWIGANVGIGAVVEASTGRDWTVEAGERSGEVGRVQLSGAPTLVLGERGQGVYAWLGPEVAALGRVRAASTGGGLEWPSPPVRVGATAGAELVSDDLVGPGASGEAHARFGVAARAGAAWGLSVWVGASF